MKKHLKLFPPAFRQDAYGQAGSLRSHSESSTGITHRVLARNVMEDQDLDIHSESDLRIFKEYLKQEKGSREYAKEGLR